METVLPFPETALSHGECALPDYPGVVITTTTAIASPDWQLHKSLTQDWGNKLLLHNHAFGIDKNFPKIRSIWRNVRKLLSGGEITRDKRY